MAHNTLTNLQARLLQLTFELRGCTADWNKKRRILTTHHKRLFIPLHHLSSISDDNF